MHTRRTVASENLADLHASYLANCSASKLLTSIALCSSSFCLSSCVLATISIAIDSPPSSSSSALASLEAFRFPLPSDIADFGLPKADPSSLFPPLDFFARFFFCGPPAALPDTRDMVSTLGEREYRGESKVTFSGGGKEVCRRGCREFAEVVESIEALRLLLEVADELISDCRLLGGSCALEGYGGEIAEL